VLETVSLHYLNNAELETHSLDVTDSQFKKFSTVLERPEWHSDPLYSTNSSRVANRRELVSLITSALSEHPTSYWLGHFRGQGFPFAPVNDIRGTFEHPQTQARDLVREVHHPRAGNIKLVAPAIMYNGHRMEVSLAFPFSAG